MSSRRPCDSDAFATSSYEMYFAQPFAAATFVNAAVSVVFPWSMWPIVPTFTWGFDRSNFSFAMAVSRCFVVAASREAPVNTCSPFDCRRSDTGTSPSGRLAD